MENINNEINNNISEYNIDMVVAVFSGLFLNVIQERYQDKFNLSSSVKVLVMFCLNIIFAFLLYLFFLYLLDVSIDIAGYKRLFVNTILSILSNQYSHQAVTKRFSSLDKKVSTDIK